MNKQKKKSTTVTENLEIKKKLNGKNYETEMKK